MKRDIKIFWIGAIVIIIGLFLFGCKSKPPRYVPIESINSLKEKEDRKIKDSIRIIEKTNIKDSTRIKDSVVYKVNEKGDIIGKEVYQWKERYRENNYLLTQLQSRYDSLLKVKQEYVEVKVPYPVVEVKEVNNLKWWQEACVWFTKLILVALALYLGLRYKKKIFSFFKKVIFKI